MQGGFSGNGRQLVKCAQPKPAEDSPEKLQEWECNRIQTQLDCLFSCCHDGERMADLSQEADTSKFPAEFKQDITVQEASAEYHRNYLEKCPSLKDRCDGIWYLIISIKMSCFKGSQGDVRNGLKGNGMNPGDDGLCGGLASALKHDRPVCTSPWEGEDKCGDITCDVYLYAEVAVDALAAGWAQDIAMNEMSEQMTEKVQQQLDAAVPILPSEWFVKLEYLEVMAGTRPIVQSRLLLLIVFLFAYLHCGLQQQ